MTNAEYCLCSEIKFNDLRVFYSRTGVYTIRDGKTNKRLGTVKIASNNASDIVILTKWLDKEYKIPILDNTERTYLSAVIKPFRERVVFIQKLDISDMTEYIDIRTEADMTDLPRFKKGTMYKDMKTGRHYTLEELDL